MARSRQDKSKGDEEGNKLKKKKLEREKDRKGKGYKILSINEEMRRGKYSPKSSGKKKGGIVFARTRLPVFFSSLSWPVHLAQLGPGGPGLLPDG